MSRLDMRKGRLPSSRPFPRTFNRSPRGVSNHDDTLHSSAR
jgi:hypothetical protein